MYSLVIITYHRFSIHGFPPLPFSFWRNGCYVSKIIVSLAMMPSCYSCMTNQRVNKSTLSLERTINLEAKKMTALAMFEQMSASMHEESKVNFDAF